MAKMTAKQQRFCDEFLTDMNATQAAIRAGYSKKTANVIAAENLTKPIIKEYIEKRMAEKEEALIAKQDEVMKYLTAVMRREKSEYVVVTVKNKRSFYAPDENGTMRKQTIETEEPKTVEIPARLSDSNKAAELLGRAFSMFKDKVDINGEVPVTIIDDLGDDDE